MSNTYYVHCGNYRKFEVDAKDKKEAIKRFVETKPVGFDKKDITLVQLKPGVTLLHGALYYDKEIKVKNEEISPVSMELSIETRDVNGTPDCKIGNFKHNFWFRTNAGIKGKTYHSRQTLERAIEKLLIKNGFEIMGWLERRCN